MGGKWITILTRGSFIWCWPPLISLKLTTCIKSSGITYICREIAKNSHYHSIYIFVLATTTFLWNYWGRGAGIETEWMPSGIRHACKLPRSMEKKGKKCGIPHRKNLILALIICPLSWMTKWGGAPVLLVSTCHHPTKLRSYSFCRLSSPHHSYHGPTLKIKLIYT